VPRELTSIREQLGQAIEKAPLIGVGQTTPNIGQRNPGNLLHLRIGIGELTARGLHEVVVDGLVDAAILRDEPEVDDAQGSDDPTDDAGLLFDLTQRGILCRLTSLEMALGQRPHESPTPVMPGDKRSARLARTSIDDQTTGRGLLYPRHRGGPRPTRTKRGGGGRAIRGSTSPPGPGVVRGGSHTLEDNRIGALRRESVVWAIVSSTSGATPDPDLRRAAAARLVGISAELSELAERFTSAGHELALVGGTVRDTMLGRLDTDARTPPDIDLTTDAHPEKILTLLDGWADAVWEVGIRFGTIGARRGNRPLEITTYRAESYAADSRKPEVTFGDSLAGDLSRRDFTVNAMAVRLPTLEFVDLHSGMTDLNDRVLRTPGTPEASFNDDPLRMLRAARFTSQLGFTVAPEVLTAMTQMADRIDIVSAERIRDELSRLLLGAHPRLGLLVLTETGLAERILPELPALQLEVDEHHRHKDVYEHSLTVLEQAIELESSHEPTSGPDLVLRLAALLHDIGKPRTRRFESDGGVSFHHHEVVGARMVRKRLTALRYPNEIIDQVSRLTELHLRFHGYGTGKWSDSAVRRYVRDADDLLDRLHKLTRADCTTRNQRRAKALQRAYDDLEQRIDVLAEQEELAAIRPDLDGNEIMRILNIPPGRVVGDAYRHMMEIRLDQGPLSAEAAEAELHRWWNQRSSDSSSSDSSNSD
jgi:poly(A) polymerase